MKSIEELKERLLKIEKQYQDKTIKTEEGILHIYYCFKAGQCGWSPTFDRYRNTKENLELAKEELLRTFGYLSRDSELIAIKKCYFEDNYSENILL